MEDEYTSYVRSNMITSTLNDIWLVVFMLYFSIRIYKRRVKEVEQYLTNRMAVTAKHGKLAIMILHF